MRKIALALAVSAAVLTAAGCGGSKKSSTPPTAPSVTVTVQPTTPATTTTAPATPTGAGAGSKECQAFATKAAAANEAFSKASSGGADLGAVQKEIDAMASGSPSSIQPTLHELAGMYGQLADALKSAGYKSGETPTPDQIGKYLAAIKGVDTAKLAADWQKFSVWVQSGCK